MCGMKCGLIGILFWHHPGESEENNEKEKSASQPKFDTGTSQEQITCSTTSANLFRWQLKLQVYLIVPSSDRSQVL
jgi:hypothetical protein